MKAYLTIVDENDKILVEEEFDACQPKQFRVSGGQSLTGAMPKNSDNASTGTYNFFGFTYQPHVAVNRPNGYVAPPPVPWQGVPQASPLNGQMSAVPQSPSFQQGPRLASPSNLNTNPRVTDPR